MINKKLKTELKKLFESNINLQSFIIYNDGTITIGYNEEFFKQRGTVVDKLDIMFSIKIRLMKIISKYNKNYQMEQKLFTRSEIMRA